MSLMEPNPLGLSPSRASAVIPTFSPNEPSVACAARIDATALDLFHIAADSLSPESSA